MRAASVELTGAEGPAPIRPCARLMHRTIQRVTEDAARFHFHTAVAALMEFQKGIADALEAGPEAPGAVAERRPRRCSSCCTRSPRT